MTRKRLKHEPLVDQSVRELAHEKGRQGLSKKMDQLTTLCGVDGCFVMYNPVDKEVFAWPGIEEAKDLLAEYNSRSEAERSKKAITQEDYLMERDRKIRAQIAKQERRNKEMKASVLVTQITNGDREIDELDKSELELLSWFSEEKLEFIHRRTELLPSQPYQSVSHPIQSTTIATAGIPPMQKLTPVIIPNNLPTELIQPTNDTGPLNPRPPLDKCPHFSKSGDYIN
ncbi:hypothetical protein Droror1_Dr00003915 [Drosera rotundifolia]